jgi:hypothetical protein
VKVDDSFAMFVIEEKGLEGGGVVSRPQTVAKFIVPYCRDKFDRGIGFSYRPASLCGLTSRYDSPKPLSTLSSQSGIMNWGSDTHMHYAAY